MISMETNGLKIFQSLLLFLAYKLWIIEFLIGIMGETIISFLYNQELPALRVGAS